jgi:ATP-dependent DNA ligase
MPANERKEWLMENLPLLHTVKLVTSLRVDNEEDLNKIKMLNIAHGYEGTIVRVFKAPYVNKRSRYLMKIKDFITEEFTLLDILTGKGNKSDIAARIIIDVDGKEVGCGIRGNWDYCSWLLKNKNNLISKQATIRHFGKTEDGSLRFPVMIDINRPD